MGCRLWAEWLNDCSQNGHADAAAALIAARADVDVCRSDRVTPLYMAAQEGYATACRCLLDAGANVTTRVFIWV